MPAIAGRTPDAGDVLWIDFGPPVGHEQAGRRPGLVLTPRAYNERSSVFLVCPISRTVSAWPFQVKLSPVGEIVGYALVDQVRSIDPTARFCKLAGHVSAESLLAVRTQLAALFSTMVRD